MEVRFRVEPGCNATTEVSPHKGRYILLATQGIVIAGQHDEAALARCWLQVSDPQKDRVAREIGLDMISPRPGADDLRQRVEELEGMLSYLTRKATAEDEAEVDDPKVKNVKLRDLLSRLGYKRQITDYRNLITPYLFEDGATVLCRVYADEGPFEPFELRLVLSGLQDEQTL